jgi:hypothetical protein
MGRKTWEDSPRAQQYYGDPVSEEINEIWVHKSYLDPKYRRGHIEASLIRPEPAPCYDSQTGEVLPNAQCVIDKHEAWVKENMVRFVRAPEKKPETTLSTGVELGCWALPSLPAGHPDGLPPLNITVEELTALMSTEEVQKELLDAISEIECIGPLHRPPGKE